MEGSKKYMEVTLSNGELIFLPKEYAIIIKRPVGKPMVSTVNGTWKWVVEESYETLKKMLESETNK